MFDADGRIGLRHGAVLRVLRYAVGLNGRRERLRRSAGRTAEDFNESTTGDRAAMVPFLRRALVEAHPRAVAEDVRTMSARLWSALAEPRIWAAAAGLLGVFALAIAACGLFGVIRHTIRQRRREFGVRMALGAQPNHVVKLVLGQAGALVAAGAAIGLAASAGATRALESVLFGVGSMVAATVVAVTAVVSRRWAGGSLAGRAAGDADRANGGPSGSSRRLVPTRFVAKHPRAGVGRGLQYFRDGECGETTSCSSTSTWNGARTACS